MRTHRTVMIVLISLGSILWLFSRKSSLFQLEQYYGHWAAIFVFASLHVLYTLLASWRWQVLLARAGKTPSFFGLYKNHHFSQAMGLIMVPVVGADYIRLRYMEKNTNLENKIGLRILLQDRLCSLWSLIIVIISAISLLSGNFIYFCVWLCANIFLFTKFRLLLVSSISCFIHGIRGVATFVLLATLSPDSYFPVSKDILSVGLGAFVEILPISYEGLGPVQIVYDTGLGSVGFVCSSIMMLGKFIFKASGFLFFLKRDFTQ